MTREELKNKISMALKDPILQQGFEIICKNLAELEKENTELTETLKTYNGCGDWDNDFHTCRVYLQHEELQMYINQLTKATDLLKKMFYLYFDPCVTHKDLENRDKLFEEVKQFIKEIEK